MTDEMIADQLEVEMMQFERFKAWWSIIKAAFAIVFKSPEEIQPQYYAQIHPVHEEPKIIFGRNKAGLNEHMGPLQYTENEYELQSDGQVVYDSANGLMWQQSGSCAAILPIHKDKYIAKINRENFAGYNNWRLPTLHEAKFLLEPKKNVANNLFIDSIFNKRQNEILTSDFSNVHECWVVNFDGGICDDACCDWFIHVRAVR